LSPVAWAASARLNGMLVRRDALPDGRNNVLHWLMAR